MIVEYASEQARQQDMLEDERLRQVFHGTNLV